MKQLIDLRRLRLQFQDLLISLGEERDEDLRKREDGIQGQTVGEFSCAQPKKWVGMTGKKSLYFLKKIVPVRVEGEERIGKVALKDTVRAIHRTIGDGIDHMISATDMVRGPGTGL